MAWTIDNALENELIKVVERDDDEGLYRIRVGDLETVVTIILRLPPGRARTEFSTSHTIKTPRQQSAYRTSRPWNDDPGSALHQAISGLTQYYREAVKAGEHPDEDWLIENDD